MSMSPSSGNTSMKSSLRPLMLRKWTLKILPRSPNQRITSKISRAGSSSISADRPLAEIQPVIRALVHRHEPLQPLDRAEHARHAAVAGRRVGIVRMAGEAHLGRVAHRNDARRGNSRSAPSSPPRRPCPRCRAARSGRPRLQRNAALREPPRPGSGAVRGMPMMLRLYLAAGMPAAAERARSAGRCDRSRAAAPGPCPAGCPGSAAPRSAATTAATAPCRARARSSRRVAMAFRSSRLQSCGLPGGSTQTCVTPSCAQTR